MSSEYNKGYERGLKNEGSSSSWGDLIGDALINPPDSYEKRRGGFEDGGRKRMEIEAERRKNS